MSSSSSSSSSTKEESIYSIHFKCLYNSSLGSNCGMSQVKLSDSSEKRVISLLFQQGLKQNTKFFANLYVLFLFVFNELFFDVFCVREKDYFVLLKKPTFFPSCLDFCLRSLFPSLLSSDSAKQTPWTKKDFFDFFLPFLDVHLPDWPHLSAAGGVRRISNLFLFLLSGRVQKQNKPIQELKEEEERALLMRDIWTQWSTHLTSFEVLDPCLSLLFRFPSTVDSQNNPYLVVLHDSLQFVRVEFECFQNGESFVCDDDESVL